MAQGFAGFGFKQPEEVLAEFQAGMQQALTSGNKDAARMAMAQQAAFAVSGGSPEYKAAKKKQAILQQAQQVAQGKSTGDDIVDQSTYYQNVQKLAIEANLPDIAIQATDKLTSLNNLKLERNKLREDIETNDLTQERTSNTMMREKGEVELMNEISTLGSRINTLPEGSRARREIENRIQKSAAILEDKRLARELAKGDATKAQFIGDDGRPHAGAFYRDGTYKDASGVVHYNATPIAPSASQAELDNKTGSHQSKNIVDFEDAVIGAVGAVQTGTELLKIAENDPAALGKPGAITNFGNEMLQTAKSIVNVAYKAGMPGYEPLSEEEGRMQAEGAEAFNWDEVDFGALQLNAVEATAFKAGVYGIAFAAAVAEQGTRPTDKDIQQFIDQVGGRSSDPQAFARTIRQFMGRQDRRLRTIAKVKGIPQDTQDLAFTEWDRSYGEFESFFDENKLAPTTTPTNTKKAPQAALDYLKANPESADQFKAKYGYIPD